MGPFLAITPDNNKHNNNLTCAKDGANMAKYINEYTILKIQRKTT